MAGAGGLWSPGLACAHSEVSLLLGSLFDVGLRS